MTRVAMGSPISIYLNLPKVKRATIVHMSTSFGMDVENVSANQRLGQPSRFLPIIQKKHKLGRGC